MATAFTGKTCQKKNIGQSRIASNSALPWETKYQANPLQAAKPPSPPTAKAKVTRMRENSSILPRLLRRPLTNMRQRRLAMAVSWPLRLGWGLMGWNTPSLSQPRKLLLGVASPDDAKENLLQRQLFAGGVIAGARSGGRLGL